MTHDSQPLWAQPDQPADARTEALLADMTTAEKVAQLGGFWDDPRGSDELIMPGDVEGKRPFDQFIEDGLGQLTRVFGTRPISAQEGAEKLETEQQAVAKASRFGLRAVAHEECLTGLETLGATVFPAPLSWGATFDPDLIEQMANAFAQDMRAAGIHQGLAPVLDVVRDYRWGRVEETIGEDPYLVGMVGAGYVRGLESAGVIATLKHYVGYSGSDGGRNHAPVSAGPRALADVYLPPFEYGIRLGGARSVMNSYSEIDGMPVAADRHLLTDVLRGEFGFDGTVVSDYWSVAFLATKHSVAADITSAATLSLRAGMDVELPDLAAYRTLVASAENGTLDPEVLDEAVRRVLRQKIELGFLDPQDEPDQPEETTAPQDLDFDSPTNRDLARQVAESAVVLLQNDDAVLPLQQSTRIAVVGPCADDARVLLGCYSYPNHVLPRFPELGLGLPVDSIYDQIRAEFPGAQVDFAAGVPLADHDTTGIPAAVQAATEADVAVVVVGDRAGMFGRGTSGEGSDAASLTLPGAQAQLVEELLESGTPVVLIVASGRPYALGAFTGRAAAIIQTFMPGVEGGSAVAGVLSGRINPSGHLPVQVPSDDGGAPHTYLGPELRQSSGMSIVKVDPAFAFGHGLSYTSFELGDLVLDQTQVPTDGQASASVQVSNTGERAGSVAVQLYARDLVASVTRPVRELIGFTRVHLEPGQQATVRATIHTDRLSFTGARGTRVVEPGEVHLMAGLSSTNTTEPASLTLTGDQRAVGTGRVLQTVMSAE